MRSYVNNKMYAMLVDANSKITGGHSTMLKKTGKIAFFRSIRGVRILGNLPDFYFCGIYEELTGQKCYLSRRCQFCSNE